MFMKIFGVDIVLCRKEKPVESKRMRLEEGM